MEYYLDSLSLLILISSFVLVANKRINSYIRTFRLQSFLLVILAGVIGMENFFSEGSLEIIVIALLILVLKVFYIPRLLQNTVNKVEYKVEKDFFLNIPIGVLICCALVMLVYYSVSSVIPADTGHTRIYLVNSISVVLIGMFFMISRKKAIGQIIGFLVLENGIFTTAMLTANGMPIIIELGMFIDLLTAVMIMGGLVFKINENFESIDINKLRNLRG